MAQPSPADGLVPGTQSQVPISVDPEAFTPTTPLDIENYTVALKYLNERMNVEKARPARLSPDTFKLDRMAAILDVLGNPQNDVRCVHIAGSKGKGSTVEMVASCLTACGYATGVYTSPHLIDVRERIRINSEMISYSQFARQMQSVARAVEQVTPAHGDATYFEVTTALALCHFAEQAVDVAAIEVGLGGRLDSTNLITPEVVGLGAIQLEHTQLLGDTLAQIAAEKAGIIKPGVTAITVPQAPEVLEVFRAVAAERGATLEVIGQTIDFSSRFVASPELGPHARISIRTSDNAVFEHIAVPLRGEHQAHNCALALAILLKLRERGFETPERLVAQGLARTPSVGRMELIAGKPRILLDGAHTPDSVSALVKAIGAHIRYDSMVIIFGCADDKDLRNMLHQVAQGADKVIFTRAAGTPRATDPRELARSYHEISGKMALSAPSLSQALDIARSAAQREDLICITGSFYLVGEAKKLLQDPGDRRPGR